MNIQVNDAILGMVMMDATQEFPVVFHGRKIGTGRYVDNGTAIRLTIPNTTLEYMNLQPGVRIFEISIDDMDVVKENHGRKSKT